jgi:sulfatase modifying factor 1
MSDDVHSGTPAARSKSAPDEASVAAAPPASDMIRIPAGEFLMGSERHYPEEAPVHRVRVDAFSMDRTPITNREFRRFVEATGYVMYAEIPGEVRA